MGQAAEDLRPYERNEACLAPSSGASLHRQEFPCLGTNTNSTNRSLFDDTVKDPQDMLAELEKTFKG